MEGSITGSAESDDNLDDFPKDDPYENKYYALLRRCDAIQQSNERLVNRIQRARKLNYKALRDRSWLLARLDKYNDDYRRAFELETKKISIKQESNDEISSIVSSQVSPGSQPKKVKGSSQPSTNCHSTDDKGEPQPKAPVKRKVKHEKTERDPNAPKRPANPFLLFCQENRSTVLEQMQKETHEDVSHQHLTKELAQNWNGLASDNKKVYYEKYDKEKERYEKEMQIYSSAANSNAHSVSNANTVAVPTVSTVKIKMCPQSSTSTSLTIPSVSTVKIKPPVLNTNTVTQAHKLKMSATTISDGTVEIQNAKNCHVEMPSSNPT
ncbi:Non-histone protein 10 [Nymphon striatum]|nr:Non-histone protein 10 [Nymphon striatum]